MMMLLSVGAFAQTRMVSGTVTDPDGATLIGVSIIVAGTTTGTTTDIDGKYSIAANDGDVLEFSYVGYEKKDVTVSGPTIDVVLSPGVLINDVVVTALGISREKKALGYAVTELSGDELMKSRPSQVITGLQGKIPGVSINQTSGAAGAGADIMIRGITSLDPSRSNSPLVVIDGVPVSNSTDVASMLPKEKSGVATNNGQSSFSNRLMDVNPADIESVSVLKGASATALYGIRAANGVLLITTKKGKAGKAQVSFNTSIGSDVLGKRPAYQFKYGMGRSGRLIKGNKYEYWYTLGPPVKDGVTEVHDPVADFFRTGQRVDNSLSVRGGNEKATYFTSFSQKNQSGIVPGSDWKRYTGRVGGNVKASEKLNFFGSVNFVKSGGKRPHEGDKSVLSALAYYTTGTDINDYINPDGSMKDLTNGTIDNPRYLAEKTLFQDNVNRTYGNLGFSYKLNEFFGFDYKFGLDQYSDFRERFVGPGFDISSKMHGFVIEESVDSRELNSILMLKFKKDLSSDISAELTVGNDILDSKSQTVNTRGENYVLDNFHSLNNTTNKFSSAYGRRKRTVGVFGLLSLGYKNFLYLDVTGRNDMSSTLPKANNSYFYPSASLSWVISDMTDLPDAISFAKLRFSLAKVGKDALPHRIGSYYNPGGNFPFGGVLGYEQSTTYGDPNLRPEFTNTTEYGADIRFLKNRLGIDFTYYKAISKDLITSVPVSNTTGKARFVTNAGSIENHGIEILLTTRPIKTKKFSWDFDVNYTKAEGKVLEIADGIEAIEYYGGGYTGIVSKLVKGGKIGDLWGRKYGRAPSGELLIGSDGFPKRVDTLTVAGNAMPNFVAGFNNTLHFGDFSISALLEWKSGGDLVDLSYRNSARNGLLKDTELRYAEVIFDGVVETGDPSNPTYEKNTKPVEIYGGNFYRSSDRFNRAAEILIQDGSWVRLRSVTVGYALPTNFLRSVNIAKANISLTATNLFLNTPFRGYDPETNFFGSGSNILGYTGLKTPGTKSYTLSLGLTF